MYKDKEIIYIKALTPIHAGAGQTLENVDMPIQRERHSNIPKVEASSLKGSIKHALYNKFKNDKGELDDNDKTELYTIFGPEDSGEDYASAVGFTDAKLLFFPIKSATDIFKLITCPYVLKRWVEDSQLQDNSNENLKTALNYLNISEGKCITDSNVPIILEEYIFEKDSDINRHIKELLNTIEGLDNNRIVILNDSDFIDLVTMYTEVITRNKIDVRTGAAEGTGLFTEEYLPSETILYFMVLASPSFNVNNQKNSQEVLDYFNENVDKVFQIGGNATIGKGFVKRSGKVGASKNEQSKER
ncbi:type III-B CRISPR module RAMP protein Cmr4 [Clostridium sporogenes]|uniref:type III-B CRISPR module RAMP protein Cmr4 n=1 Tax=Clostridium sporogenes TaxID=1509 RepID=UPI000E16B108|nr:type III-B CRISPR module RAMP protein Cmr4 [Clostridium sporogenes]MDS1009253.1 type III-B CRISPR module RAMP protein Cmr4 [Clostridium sporogenes]MDU6336129.1 type III-B CRISPR module RAMP protein Cmr4 [Clostridium sporogenes]NFQ85362.1 type III-B CRISPR module RAMP protein Cmr4 [Clostridium sporogenes]SUY62187.1 Cmr4 family CRISPR-associated RAMP protein [Clostridium sporogenes]